MDRSTVYSKCCDGMPALSPQTARVDVTVANRFTVGMQLLLGTACRLLIASL